MKPKDKSRDSSLGDYLIEAIQELDVYPVHTEIYNEDEDDGLDDFLGSLGISRP